MTTVVTYFTNATNETYSDESLDYITGFESIINNISTILGVSAGAIAGAIAEENTAYSYGDQALDLYAKSSIDADEVAEGLLTAIAEGPAAVSIWVAENTVQLLGTTRTHEEWFADYQAVKDLSGVPGRLDKLLHPALIDVAPANFKISTAINLITKYASEYPTLGLNQYTNDYAKLVNDLIDEQSPLTTQLYGLYLKEAEEWYIDNNAFNGQWDSLPQTYKDALLITFTKLGEEKMEENKRDLYLGRGLPYEPQPGLTNSGGMNHLLNATSIGNALNLNDYTIDLVGVDDFYDQALEQSEAGLASRYALYRLRYTSITGLDYSSYNTNGELDLYNPVTGKGLTDAWIRTRSSLLGFRVLDQESDNDGKIDQSLGLPFPVDGDLVYEDIQSGYKLEVDGLDLGVLPVRKVLFGGNDADFLTGESGDDRLFGDIGNDKLNGEGGDDYLEGGEGNDTLLSSGGNDTLYGVSGEDNYFVSGSGSTMVTDAADSDRYIIGALDENLLTLPEVFSGTVTITDNGTDVGFTSDNEADDYYYITGDSTADITINDAAGEDRYVIENFSGTLRINDASNAGEDWITVDGVTLGDYLIPILNETNAWNTATGDFRVTQNSPITVHTENGGQIVLESFTDGDFGICLGDGSAEESVGRISTEHTEVNTSTEDINDLTYRVERGDTVSTTMRRMGLSFYNAEQRDQFLSVNNIENADLIFVGQILTNPFHPDYQESTPGDDTPEDITLENFANTLPEESVALIILWVIMVLRLIAVYMVMAKMPKKHWTLNSTWEVIIVFSTMKIYLKVTTVQRILNYKLVTIN